MYTFIVFLLVNLCIRYWFNNIIRRIDNINSRIYSIIRIRFNLLLTGSVLDTELTSSLLNSGLVLSFIKVF